LPGNFGPPLWAQTSSNPLSASHLSNGGHHRNASACRPEADCTNEVRAFGRSDRSAQRGKPYCCRRVGPEHATASAVSKKPQPENPEMLREWWDFSSPSTKPNKEPLASACLLIEARELRFEPRMVVFRSHSPRVALTSQAIETPKNNGKPRSGHISRHAVFIVAILPPIWPTLRAVASAVLLGFIAQLCRDLSKPQGVAAPSGITEPRS
jgi:hypothetical protein